MASNRKQKTLKPSVGYDWTNFTLVLGALGLLLTTFIAYKASLSDRKLFSIGLIALFGGLLIESYRVSRDLKKLFLIFLGSYFLSLFNFFPWKNEQIYSFENHLETWPYFFLFLFTMAFAIWFKDKVTPKLTEGTALILSISLVYWTIDYGFTDYRNWFAITLMIIAILLTAFSIVNALANIYLSESIRLTLSIWSTIIMFGFAVDNIIRVFSNPEIENSKYLSDGFYIGFQYFLLGVSAVYIMNNYVLLSGLLPSRGGNYRLELKEAKKEHLDRFSSEQIYLGHALLCILFTTTIYILNYKFQFLPRHTMIWFVFLAFPIFLRLFDFIILGRKKY